MKTLEVARRNLIEWKSNPFKRKQINDRELEASIAQLGIKSPLDVVPEDGKYLVVDGNRRLRIAQKLKLRHLPVIVHDEGENPYELAIILNATGRVWDGQTLGQFIAARPELITSVPPRFRRKLTGMLTFFGSDFSLFIHQHTINTYDYGLYAAKYVGRYDDKGFCHRAVWWVGKHRLVLIVRFAMKMGIDPAELEQAIEKDVPLKITT